MIVIPTLGQTNLREELAPLAVSSALAAVFAGGVLFAILRLRTAHLAAPIAAHITFNAVLLVGLSLGG